MTDVRQLPALAREVRAVLREPAPLVADLRHWFREVRRPVERRNRRDDEALRHLLAFALPADANCVDVGANRGEVLAEILRCAPGGRHHAFEPLPDLADGLARRFPTVTVHQAAVADAPGTSAFTHVVGAPALSGLRSRSRSAATGEEEVLEVRVTTLDEALPEDYAPALIKIDVEGAELGVLRGGMGVLRRHRPIVVFEHGLGGAPAFGTTPEQVHDLLAGEIGLRIFDLDGAGPYTRARFAAEAFAAEGGHWNWVARP